MEPQIKKYFNSFNLVKQPIYKSKEKYKAVYINKDLYEELFNKKFDNNEKEYIENLFSISLCKNGDKIDEAYVDRQSDPLGISLNGNLGSGRAFFYKERFNIKGDKTVLATSKDKIYSDGKFALAAAIKEAILSNILYKYNVSAYQTLAVLYTGEQYEFTEHYLDNDNTIKTDKFTLPCAIEVRVYNEDSMYRISNCIADDHTLDIESLYKKIANIEAFKYMYKFLHGSWSVGNLSTHGKMLDFDTSAFLDFRNPQYSNTNKYKASYFGYEIEGQQKIIDLFDNKLNLKNINEFYLKRYFCKLLSIDYNNWNSKLDEIFLLFMSMSKMHSNHNTLIYNDYINNSAIYNFSLFFQYFSSLMNNDSTDVMLGLSLLINNYNKNDINCPKLTKEMSEEYFNEYFIQNDNEILKNGILFINKYIELINENIISKEYNFNRFVMNENIYFLSGINNLYGYISNLALYNDFELSNKIIEILIQSNYRNCKNNNYLIKLKVYDYGLIFINLNLNYFNVEFIPFKNIDFSKCIINNKEYYMKYIEETKTFKTENIKYNNINIFYNLDYKIIVNGKFILK